VVLAPFFKILFTGSNLKGNWQKHFKTRDKERESNERRGEGEKKGGKIFLRYQINICN
jgi:hypothetical protein